MYNQKIPIPEIRRKYEVDPYVDTEKIIKQIEEVEEAKKGHHPIALVSALR